MIKLNPTTKFYGTYYSLRLVTFFVNLKTRADGAQVTTIVGDRQFKSGPGPIIMAVILRYPRYKQSDWLLLTFSTNQIGLM